MRIKIRLCILLLGFATVATAQEEVIPPVHRGKLIGGLSFQTFGLAEFNESVSQAAFPIALMFPMSDHFNVTIVHTPGYSWWRSDYEIMGLSDTWIQGAYMMWDEKLLFNVGVGAPTGKTRLTINEIILTRNWLSRNVFRFRLPVYGQGLCGKGGMMLALPIGESVVFGVGGQYMVRRAYNPARIEYSYLDNGVEQLKVEDKEYKPGDEVSGQIGFDFKIGDNFKAMLDATYTHFWRDIQEGEEVYGPGDKIGLNVGLFYRFNTRYVWTQFVYRQRGKNEVLSGLSIAEEALNTNGPQYEFNFYLKAVHFENAAMMILLDARYEGANDVGKQDDLMFGGGVGLNVQLLESMSLDFHLKFIGGYYRSLTDNYSKQNLTGIDTYLGFQIDL